MNINIKTVIVIAASTLVVGLLIGWLIFGRSEGQISEGHQHESEIEGVKTWTCSMHPQIRMKDSGACPICGMELIPLATVGDEDISPLAVSMSPTAMQLANVSTNIVGKIAPVKTLRLNGKVHVNEMLISKIPAHFHGRIEKLYVNFTGERIVKGQLLAEVYSPELVTAQQELQLTYQNREANPLLYQSARRKLENWKIAESEIRNIESSEHTITKVKIHAHHPGFVLTRNITQGDHVQMGDILFEIADLSKVWILFDIYESDMPWVKIRDKVSFTITSLPGEKFIGKISYIDPVIDPRTRVAKARLEVVNTGLKLKPEMFTSGTVEARLPVKSDAVVIPKSAVLWTGERSVVYVKETTSKRISFLMRQVTLGPALGDSYIIEDGLKQGEEIAVNGAFSIDAAAQLAGKPSMMNPNGGGSNSNPANLYTSVQKLDISNSAKNVLNPLYVSYFFLKDALTQDNFEKAQKAGDDLDKKLSQVDMTLFDGESRKTWMNYSNSLNKELQHVLHFQNIEELRKAFIDISKAMIGITKTFNPHSKPIYIQFCPMADNNKGADWLSLEKEVVNPYFGASMLSCGEVKEEIK